MHPWSPSRHSFRRIHVHRKIRLASPRLVRSSPKILTIAKLAFGIVVDLFLDRFEPNITAWLSRDAICLFRSCAKAPDFSQRCEKLRRVVRVVPVVGIDHNEYKNITGTRSQVLALTCTVSGACHLFNELYQSPNPRQDWNFFDE